ncbi:MAG TPA: T9SS type A sorting domain-containing protein [Saprospiraceae bacterium]|nr:T9SS type A sorting domain-containing protein [Saprospiraceae bacterium]
MNRLFFTFFLSLFALLSGVQAQEVYFEDFSNGMPDDYILVDRDGNTPASGVSFVTDAWVISSTGAAMSTSWYTPAGTSDDWMITSEIDLPEVDSNKTLFLTWAELTPDPDYRDGYDLMINTTGQTNPDSFVNLITVPQAQTSWTVKTYDLSAYQGMAARFAYVNTSNDKYLLLIDDIAIKAYGENDMAVLTNLNPNYTLVGNKLKVEVGSFGAAAAANCDLSYSIDGGDTVTANINLSGLSLLETKEVEHPVAPTMTAGLHSVKMWVSNVNGGIDVDLTNDTLTFDIVVYDESVYTDRNTVLEVFTSSTCPPCKPGNAKIASVVGGMDVKPILLKYQQDFPGTGDPYATDETVARRDFYDISAVPTTQIDGLFKTLNPNDLVVGDITSAQAVGALVDIEASYELDSANQSIHVYGSYTPRVNLVNGTKMILAIKEWTTKKNKKSNGETQFDNVVKKLYNGIEGIDVSGKEAGTVYPFDYTYQFNGNYRLPSNGQEANRIDHAIEHSVENFNNLGASIIFESSRDQYILQAGEAGFVVGLTDLVALKDLNIYPNPSADFLNVSFATSERLPITIQVLDLSGKVLISQKLGELAKGAYQHTLDLSKLVNGTYDVTILSGSTGISSTFTVVK